MRVRRAYDVCGETRPPPVTPLGPIDVAANVAIHRRSPTSAQAMMARYGPVHERMRRTPVPLLISALVANEASSCGTRRLVAQPRERRRCCFASRGSWVRVPSSPPRNCWSGRCKLPRLRFTALVVPSACHFRATSHGTSPSGVPQLMTIPGEGSVRQLSPDGVSHGAGTLDRDAAGRRSAHF